MDILIVFLFLFVINLYFSLFLNFNQTNKNLISLIFFFIFLSLFIIFYFKFEFLGYAYLLVYVGAIAVLFLFLLISVNIKIESKKAIFNKESINFFFLFNFINVPLYFLFSSIYEKIKNVSQFSYYSNYIEVKKNVLVHIADETQDYGTYWSSSNGNLTNKLDLLNSLLTRSYRNNINLIDNYSFLRYLNNKITILGDYFLNYHGFFLIIISLLLFISIIVSVTICLSVETKK